MASQNGFEISQLPEVSCESSARTEFLPHKNARLAFDYIAPLEGVSKARQLLVLVNGFARPRADFRAFRKRIHAQMPHLATLAFDNRGAGETEGGLEELSVEVMAADAAFLARSYARTLGLQGYHCLGISMGGMICQTWAAHDPMVMSATLVSTTPGGRARVWPEGVDPEQALSRPFEEWPQDYDIMLRRMTRYFGPKFRQASPLLIEIMVKNMLKTHTGAASQGNAKAQYNATVAFDGTGSASDIGCPVLVLTGTDDQIIPRGNSEALCRLIPQAKMKVFDGIGHLLLIEDPENFVAQVRSFLNELGQ
ncbi:MAG: hypothetical protein RIR26_2424 [Pseudomonadota bacterium]|jgi:pimeloyl-ACP methyl ester carboxylesterase